MTVPLTRRAIACAMLGAWIAAPARAQLAVYDPTNYASNVLQAARALEQINNQIRSLQNQALSLANQARNLAQLPYSSLQTIRENLSRISGLMREAQQIAYDVRAIEQALSRDYALDRLASDVALVGAARQRWANSAAAFRDALKVQAGVVSGMPAVQAETEALLSASQGASGVVQAAQAGNQLLALQSQQLTDLTALIAAQGRAAALEQAERSAARAQAQEQFRRFMDRGAGYQPQAVEMFR
ncbi:MAG: P-type conjugative transfer protein TrbJ [Phenylobacterium sp.]|jgi:P-type conjugative transfer protein TrbJ|uniref:P-type conjugative transfer protein TrbJ n=1 Tax=Phenylobacterium sp. TaxID=1871053 RepID=UPI001B411004|nr:P-type conjugative transfer protein TrbJ [Phenylobacterium sp.]MBP7648255.1 P-type conjugative transfer protein TrbJ [Phenylobacterium sp.]MBP7814850.1 P-type conjugative transfer protein TrbJ [Phenylobacterium sp.]MBP9753393.1 P-type conjugative transfer protein TrbJ [Phenylobacterium sp.]MDP1600206.1 P-type conjugative transfer protein TrbJ [Phenylobacterium sp.]MDP3593603.1 P-type conjugative transfer protein TrbJ [Phenylobacterium sp.]